MGNMQIWHWLVLFVVVAVIPTIVALTVWVLVRAAGQRRGAASAGELEEPGQ
ncbi:hypothetical protein [Antribacter gilvus]|uniref:hypothetical protein n=1 Tax=Antribacter gilvus TaxID=2304675 RepID=UPI0013E0948A|nr:hypothetical protein [Antribacter gilvus]